MKRRIRRGAGIYDEGPKDTDAKDADAEDAEARSFELFHSILPPMKNGNKDPIKTGFTMANGKPLPFWHVMFQTLNVKAERGTDMASAY